MRRPMNLLAAAWLAATLPLGTSAQGLEADGLRAAPFALRVAGRCLEVNPPQVRVDGARAQLQRCDDSPGQAWRLLDGRLVHAATGRCLDVHGPDVGHDGARVQLVNCHGGPNQRWRAMPAAGALAWMADADGRCLTLHGAERGQSLAQVHTMPCRDEPAQRFELLLATPPEPAPAAPRVRNVEAGPLWNNGDAQNKCPTVCGSSRWTGHWFTTVPARMSVCVCEEAVPQAVGPRRPGQDERGPGREAHRAEPMPAARLDALVRSLEREAFPTRALRTLELALDEQQLSTPQVRRLMAVFPFGSDRLRVLELAVPRLVDRANAFQLLEGFDFEMEREQARALLERQRGGR